MSGAASGRSGSVFISYRREETAYPAAWLYDRLAERFGDDRVFKDVDSVELGDDFAQVLEQAVGSCDVLLALIGDRWLTATDEGGRRRIDDPEDFVRLEIEAALGRNVRVIPILVDGAPMPVVEELPDGMAGLARRQALELSPSRFGFDTDRLLRVLDRTMTEIGAPPPREDPARIEATSAQGSIAERRVSTVPTVGDGPDDARRRRFRIVLVVACVAVVAIGVTAIVAVTRSDSSSTSQDDAGTASGASSGVVLQVDPTPVTSEDGLRLSELDATSPRDPAPPAVGEVITVSYVLTNTTDDVIELDDTFVGVRFDDGDVPDAENDNENTALQPGASVNARGRVLIDEPGTWELWPCYTLADGTFCPDKWQLITFLTTDS